MIPWLPKRCFTFSHTWPFCVTCDTCHVVDHHHQNVTGILSKDITGLLSSRCTHSPAASQAQGCPSRSPERKSFELRPTPAPTPPFSKKSDLGHVILLWLSTLHARQGCCYSSEQLLHIVTCLGRGLYEHHVQLLGLKKFDYNLSFILVGDSLFSPPHQWTPASCLRDLFCSQLKTMNKIILMNSENLKNRHIPSMMITSLPLSVLTSSIHLLV